MPETTAGLMREWLATGNEVQRRAAAARLAMIARGEPGVTTPAPPFRFFLPSPAWRDRINTCPYRECPSGCRSSRCHAGKGDHFGNVSLQDCAACLGHPGAARPTPLASPKKDPAVSQLNVFYTYTGDLTGLGCSVLDVATGNLWSPSSRAFVPAAGAADALIPMHPIGGALYPGVFVAVVPDVPVPAEPAAMLVSVHPAAGGAPVSAPFAASSPVAELPPGVRLAVVLG